MMHNESEEDLEAMNKYYEEQLAQEEKIWNWIKLGVGFCLGLFWGVVIGHFLWR